MNRVGPRQTAEPFFTGKTNGGRARGHELGTFFGQCVQLSAAEPARLLVGRHLAGDTAQPVVRIWTERMNHSKSTRLRQTLTSLEKLWLPERVPARTQTQVFAGRAPSLKTWPQ